MPESVKATDSQKKTLAITTIIALFFGAYFLRAYFTLFIFAGILAFSFNPFYQKRLKKTGNPNTAASQTLIVTFLVIIIPFILIVAITAVQINHTARTISASSHNVNIADVTQKVIVKVNRVLSNTPTSFRITNEWLKNTQSDLIGKVGSFVGHNAASYAGSVFRFFTTAIIFIFVFLSLLKNQITLRQIAQDLNPMGPKMSDLYVSKVSAMTKAMVKGQLLIAIVQGFTDAALIYIGGVHTAFFFFFMLLSALSFVPLGGGIIAIPVGIIMILSGNIIGGIVVIAGHLLIVTNIDNILRPRLVPKEAKLDSALTILSVFAGISLLGFLGIIVGPVIMILIVTTIQVYRQVFRSSTQEKNIKKLHK